MKIKLKNLKLSDAKRVYYLFVNDKVLENLYTEKKAAEITLKEEKEWLKRVLNDYGEKAPKNYSVGIYAGEELIGSIGAKDIDWKNLNCEIGYWIGEEYWGNGYVTEAIKQFTEILFKKFKIVRIWAAPFLHNKASQRVLEKAGFKKEGIRKKTIKKGNKFRDDVMYVKIK